MLVAMYYSNSDIRLEEMPVPEIGRDELLVKVHACGICGSDVMEWYRIHKVPLVLGHEISGEIAQVGEDLKQFKVGDRVSVAHHVPCKECYYCLAGHPTVCETLRKTNVDPGGFSQYIRVPSINIRKGGVLPLPDSVSFEESSFTEPLACVLRGQRFMDINPGSTVLVIGSGISGVLHIRMALANGAGKVFATEISDFRKEAALRVGANEVIDGMDDVPKRLMQLNEKRPADYVIITSASAKTINDALRSVDREGKVLFFAPTAPGVEVPVSFNDIFWRNEVALLSSYGGSPEDYDLALRLIANKTIEVEDLITHRLGLDEVAEGFSLVVEADNSIKVIIQPA